MKTKVQKALFYQIETKSSFNIEKLEYNNKENGQRKANTGSESDLADWSKGNGRPGAKKLNNPINQ